MLSNKKKQCIFSLLTMQFLNETLAINKVLLYIFTLEFLSLHK